MTTNENNETTNAPRDIRSIARSFNGDFATCIDHDTNDDNNDRRTTMNETTKRNMIAAGITVKRSNNRNATDEQIGIEDDGSPIVRVARGTEYPAPTQRRDTGRVRNDRCTRIYSVTATAIVLGMSQNGHEKIMRWAISELPATDRARYGVTK